MTLGKVASGSAVWNHVGRVTEYVLFYLSSILVARALGVEENGRYAFLLSISQLLLVVASLGLEASLNTFIPRLSQSTGSASRLRYLMRRFGGLRAGSIILAVTVGGAVALIGNGGEERISDPLLLIAGLTVVRALIALPVIGLTALFRTRQTAAINVAARLLELGAILTLSDLGVTVSVWIAVLGGIAVLQLAAYAIFSRDLWLGPVEPIPLRPALVFGLVFWVNTFVDYFLGRYGDLFFLTWLGAGAHQASVYDVAFSLVQVGMIGMTAGMSGVSLATFSRLAVDPKGDLGGFYAFVVRLTSLLTIPLFGYLGFFAAPIVVTLYAEPFLGAVPVLQTMLVFRVACRLFAGGENTDLLLATGRVRTLVGINAVAAVANIGLNMFLIPRLGAIGAAIAGGTALLLSNIGSYIVVFRMVPASMPVRNWAVLVGVAAVSGGVATLLIPATTLPGLIGGSVAYGGLVLAGLLLFRPLASRDGDWLLRHAPAPLAFLQKFAKTHP